MKNNIEISPEKKYQWRQDWGSPIAHTDINLIISELEIIQEVNGSLTPSLVLESAKNKSSQLHRCFTWDDTLAANKWRLRQATEMLGNIQVKVVSDGESKIYRVYQTVKSSGFKGNENLDYKRYELMTKENILFSISVAIKDLVKVKHRIHPLGNYNVAIKFIDKAIEELSKESTETKEEVKPVPVLSAVA